MERLFDLLNGVYPMSTGLQNYLANNLKSRKLKKKEFLLRKNQVNTIGSFVNTGLLHCYYLVDDKKITSWFLPENRLASSVNSFFTQQPSYEFIQALEPTEILYLTFEELQFAYKNYLELNFIMREMVQHYYMLKEEHTYQLQTGTTNERFIWFCNTFPDIITRVPMRHIATFLNVAEETLSRIRSSQKP